MSNNRVRLLFKKGMSCYRERRSGCRKRKSVRGALWGFGRWYIVQGPQTPLYDDSADSTAHGVWYVVYGIWSMVYSDKDPANPGFWNPVVLGARGKMKDPARRFSSEILAIQ